MESIKHPKLLGYRKHKKNHRLPFRHNTLTNKCLFFSLMINTIIHSDCFEALKGIVHPKMKILSSFTLPQVVPNLHECLLNTKEDILKKVCNQAVLGHH